MGDKEQTQNSEIANAVEAAHSAARTVAEFDQSRIDQICEAMARVALAESGRLGILAHEETGFGKPEDKREKNRFAAEDVWNYFKGMRTVGVISDQNDIVEIASPRGVVAAIIPSTNPTSTAIFKIIIALKSRNTIILSPHPSAARCIAETARIMRAAGIAAGLPPDSIYCIQQPTIESTEALMRHKKTAVILATGGIGMVRAAYSSGKPAFGVGPGNVPVYIERSADVEKAVRDILTSTCFDNGTICASEQSVVVDTPIEAEVREQFRMQGAHFLNSQESEAVGKVLVTPERTLNARIVGKSAEHIAGLAGISIPAGIRCLLSDCAGVGREYPWSIEKLSPTLAFFVADGLESGAARCQEILRYGGMGHTAGMHTRDRGSAVAFGLHMPASRVVINSPTTHGAIGFSTALPPSMTLGCGSWGGNVTSDNVSPIHLMDIKRVAFETRPVISSPKS
ncbi:MAG: aldehyde dehydrogenase family protein, partial [Acidobacteriota bacterium]